VSGASLRLAEAFRCSSGFVCLCDELRAFARSDSSKSAPQLVIPYNSWKCIAKLLSPEVLKEGTVCQRVPDFTASALAVKRAHPYGEAISARVHPANGGRITYASFTKAPGYLRGHEQIIHTSVDTHMDIQARISLRGHPAMDIRKQLISINGYPCFMDISLQLSMLLWIYISICMDFFGYPCIDLQWILDPGLAETISNIRVNMCFHERSWVFTLRRK